MEGSGWDLSRESRCKIEITNKVNERTCHMGRIMQQQTMSIIHPQQTVCNYVSDPPD